MFTANTMASVSEALGMALPGSASAPAVDRRRDDLAFQSGQAVMGLLAAGIRPRQIMTKEAFENAIAVVMAVGGSTNAEYVPNHIGSSRTTLHKIYHDAKRPSHLLLPIIPQ